MRQDIINLEGKKAPGMKFYGIDPVLTTILVIGGSQGARSVNRAISKMLPSLLEEKVQLVWQCGISFEEEAQEVCRSLPKDKAERVKVFDFITRMDLAYAVADIVISRAGAIAISELCIAGKPVILVPLPSAAEDHQTKNARSLEDRDAAIMVADSKQDYELLPALKTLLDEPERRESMGSNIKAMARPDATEKIVDEVIKLLKK